MELRFDENEFGRIPERPLHLSVETISINEEYSGGSLILKRLAMNIELEGGIYRLPFDFIAPKTAVPCPTIIVIGDGN